MAIGIAALGTLVSVTDIVGSLQDVMFAGAAIGAVGAIGALFLFRRPVTPGAVAAVAQATA